MPDVRSRPLFPTLSGHALAALILCAAFALAGLSGYAAGARPIPAEAKPLPVKASPRTDRKPKRTLLNFDYIGASRNPLSGPIRRASLNSTSAHYRWRSRD